MSGWKKKKAVARRYDVTARMYDLRYAEEQAPKYEVALSNIKNSSLRMVLDAGCGTGLFFDSLAGRSEAVCGLDISRRTLLMAKSRARPFSNVEVVCADVDFMPFKNEAFSHAFAFTVLQNVPRPGKALRELNRIVEDKGEIIVTGLKRIFSKKTFLMLLENAGLDIDGLIDEDSLTCYVAVCKKLSR